MYLAPVSGPSHSLSERERERGPERGLSGPSVSLAARPSTRGPPPRLRGLRHKKKMTEVVSSGRSGASLAAGARAGAEVFEKPSGDVDDDDDGDDAQVRACLSVRVSTSRRPSSALTGPRPAPRESAEGVGPVAGSVGYHRFARARARRAEARGARAPRSRSPLTPRGRRVTRPPGVSTTILDVSSLSSRRLARERSRVRRGRCEERRARCGRRGAGSRRAPERRRSIRLSSSLSLVREREYRQFRYTLLLYLFASPSQSPLLLRAFVPRAERDLRGTLMILPQVHLRKPCYDFYFL